MGQYGNWKDTIKEILSFGGENNNEYTLIEYQKGNRTEWNVAHWYNPETRSWSAGNYAYSLEQALATCLEKMNSEYIKTDRQIETERKYGITYDRMSEIASKALDSLDDNYDTDEAIEYMECEIGMEEMEFMYFEKVRRLDDYYSWEYGNSSDDFTIIVDDEDEYVYETTLNPNVPDRYCNRVEIDGKYYYFS